MQSIDFGIGRRRQKYIEFFFLSRLGLLITRPVHGFKRTTAS